MVALAKVEVLTYVTLLFVKNVQHFLHTFYSCNLGHNTSHILLAYKLTLVL